MFPKQGHILMFQLLVENKFICGEILKRWQFLVFLIRPHFRVCCETVWQESRCSEDLQPSFASGLC